MTDEPQTTGDSIPTNESTPEAPFSAGLTWQTILERALEEARYYAEPRSLGDALLDAEGHLRLAYDRGQQDERAAIVAFIRRVGSAFTDNRVHEALAYAVEGGEHHA